MQSKRRKQIKLPNGFGSIVFLGENRRKPYGALKTIGWDENTGKQIKKYISYEETYNKAYQKLLEYNNMPYALDHKNITLGEVFNVLEPKLKEMYLNGTMSQSNYKNMMSVYNNYLIILKDEKVMELKKKDVQKVIDNCNLKHTGRGYIKNIFQRLIEYCIDELELPINKSIYDLELGKKEKSNKHFPLTQKEIEIIKELANINLTAKLIMIYLYTGLRPSELLNIETINVFLSEGYMIGGEKTEAGTNRIIPIHSEIQKYVEQLYNCSKKYLVINEKTKQKMSYDTYQKKFDTLMNDLKFNHTPHDTRHTFATKCSEVGISDVNIKILMGHSLSNDVTNNVYIHKTVDALKKEIEKIKY